ncbi:ferredoxin reductase family protein [Actinocrinis puniceicyclus]|uniref:Ferredoxin reductase family protein n=1 Tax=Actinocrinis puniceicyclus TaxID=977794 RepID=A0A8J8BC72_9ACTN|nr:ferredoxin reductase family protein [Actinocrinis puniceicyclus]MBS2963235.1 ferredoxin reductase family protein [Actinocrinis puniceicyclus]
MPPREYIAAALAGAVGVGAVAVLAFWWMDTPGTSLADLGGQATAAGQAAGMLGAYLVLIQVLLMARIPWLERAIGSDWLTGAHRASGESLVLLLFAHAALITLGYAGSLRKTPTEFFRILDMPYVFDAALGLGLLLGIGFISARAIRRRVRYETWHYTHLLVYLAIVLFFTHEFTAGSTFETNYSARLFAVGLYAAVALTVLAFRVVKPVVFSLRHRLRVADVQRESNDVVSIYLTGRNLRRLQAEPGQYFRWRFLTPGCWWQAHPFSLSAAPNREWLRITVGALGDHTRALQKLQPGVRVFAEGPYGAMTAALRTRRKVVLIAGGIGITPLRALIDPLAAAGEDLVLLYRASRRGDIVFHRELEWLAAGGRLTVHYLLGPRDARPAPLGAARLTALVPDIQSRDVFVCGSPGMIQAAAQALREARVPRRHIHQERFTL